MQTATLPPQFADHTLVHAVGSLGNTVLKRFLNDPSERDRYEQWLLSAAVSGARLHPLVQTGSDAAEARLLGRAQRGVFILEVQAREFACTAAFAALGPLPDLPGVPPPFGFSVLSFDGRYAPAVVFCLATSAQVAATTPFVSSSRSPLSPRHQEYS